MRAFTRIAATTALAGGLTVLGAGAALAASAEGPGEWSPHGTFEAVTAQALVDWIDRNASAPGKDADPVPADVPGAQAPEGAQGPTGPAGPSQGNPAQEAPGQEAPGQQAPGQQAPGQEAPAQQTPGQQAPGQEAPGQQAPGQQAPGSAAGNGAPDGATGPVRPQEDAPADADAPAQAPTGVVEAPSEATAEEAPADAAAPAQAPAKPSDATGARP
ncbi:hypothetical protein [Nocardiopsis sp. CA-288880]|uniref:hypothetical protein n=1 Tax=Nocardiopsis sp. CA-288880 TaxID=3239995 RepID=UPI003D983676